MGPNQLKYFAKWQYTSSATSSLVSIRKDLIKKYFLSGNGFKWLKLKSKSIRLHPASTNIVMDAEIFSYHVYVYTYDVGKKAHHAMVQPPYASNACLACGVLWDARQLWLIVLGVMCYCVVTWLWYGIVRKIDLVCIQSRVWCGVVQWVMQLIEARPRDNGPRADGGERLGEV